MPLVSFPRGAARLEKSLPCILRDITLLSYLPCCAAPPYVAIRTIILVPPLPTLDHFLRVTPVERVAGLATKVLNKTGRALVRVVHEMGEGLGVDVIAYVCAVPEDVVRRALDNSMGDLLSHDKWLVPPEFRRRYFSAFMKEAAAALTAKRRTLKSNLGTVDIDESSTSAASTSSPKHHRKPRHRDPEEFWPNPTAQDFIDGTPIPAPFPMGLRSRNKMLDRIGRAICRIMYAHGWKYQPIADIFGVSHNPVRIAALNEYVPGDDPADDYWYAGALFFALFGPDSIASLSPSTATSVPAQGVFNSEDATSLSHSDDDSGADIEDDLPESQSEDAGTPEPKAAFVAGAQQSEVKAVARAECSPELDSLSQSAVFSDAALVDAEVVSLPDIVVKVESILPKIESSPRPYTCPLQPAKRQAPIYVADSDDDLDQPPAKRANTVGNAPRKSLAPSTSTTQPSSSTSARGPATPSIPTKTEPVEGVSDASPPDDVMLIPRPRKTSGVTDFQLRTINHQPNAEIAAFLRGILVADGYDFQHWGAMMCIKGIRGRKELLTMGRMSEGDCFEWLKLLFAPHSMLEFHMLVLSSAMRRYQ
ncbi:hypothetical protein C8R43DRAFT_1118144 [Mycena crocata]|nr:hypothetical protein C8R43DRAFT_1118144 [Mycena crocata]